MKELNKILSNDIEEFEEIFNIILNKFTKLNERLSTEEAESLVQRFADSLNIRIAMRNEINNIHNFDEYKEFKNKFLEF